MLALLLYIIIVLKQSYGYYLSLSELKWHNASNYCHSHCKSELASIHSEEDHQNIIQLINYHNEYIVADFWIGLNNLSGQGFIYPDHSPFDYGDNVWIKGTYPWFQHRPKGQVVVALDKTTLTFKDVDVNGRRHFICNQCDGVLSKYVIPNTANIDHDRYNESQKLCKDRFNTNLVSLHNNNDMKEAQILCQERTKSVGCWTGLYDETGILNFKQIDGTLFDYGNNMDGEGIYPWIIEQPDNLDNDGIPHCVMLSASKGYLWSANTSCIQSSAKGICQIPSEICYPYNWQVIYGTDWNFNDIPCQLKHNLGSYHGDNLLKLFRKHWETKSGVPLIIEFMFTIQTGLGQAGLYLFMSHDVDYYVGIDFQQNNIFLRETIDPSVYTTNSVENNNMNYSMGTYYSLRIELLDNTMDIYFNNTLYLSYNGVSNVAQNISVGIKHIMSDIDIKWLYVSGTPYIGYNITSTLIPTLAPTTAATTGHPTYTPTDSTLIPTSDPTQSAAGCNKLLFICPDGTMVGRDKNNNCEFFPCPSINPSMDPTMEPTIFPSKAPTERPTQRPTTFCIEDQSAEIVFSFDYLIDNKYNASLKEIENILLNITDILMIIEIERLSGCDIIDEYSKINITYQYDVEIDVFICYICNEGTILNVGIIQTNLSVDFIDTINAETILNVVANSSIITVNIHEAEQEEPETTKPIEIAPENEAKMEDEAGRFWVIMGTMFGLLCICIITICVIIQRLANKEDVKHRNIRNSVALSFVQNPGMIRTHIMKKFTKDSIYGEEDDKKGNSYKQSVDDIDPHNDADIVGDINTMTQSSKTPGDIIIDDMDGDTPDNGEESEEPFINESSNEIQRNRGYTHKNDTFLVKQWLKNEVGLIQYYQIFIQNGYAALDFIAEITRNEQLLEIGIDIKHHRMRIIEEIMKLRHEQVIPYQAIYGNNNDDADNKYGDIKLEVSMNITDVGEYEGDDKLIIGDDDEVIISNQHNDNNQMMNNDDIITGEDEIITSDDDEHNQMAHDGIMGNDEMMNNEMMDGGMMEDDIIITGIDQVDTKKEDFQQNLNDIAVDDEVVMDYVVSDIDETPQ